MPIIQGFLGAAAGIAGAAEQSTGVEDFGASPELPYNDIQHDIYSG